MNILEDLARGGNATTAVGPTGHDVAVAVPAVAAWVGLGAALGIGMLAGSYPALRAARLAPAEALRAI